MKNLLVSSNTWDRQTYKLLHQACEWHNIDIVYDSLNAGDPGAYVAYGSIQHIDRVQKMSSQYSDIFSDDLDVFSPTRSIYLVSYPSISPLAWLKDWDDLFAFVDSRKWDRFFVKPDSARKDFNGAVVERMWIPSWDFFKQYKGPLVCSEEVELLWEVRVFYFQKSDRFVFAGIYNGEGPFDQAEIKTQVADFLYKYPRPRRSCTVDVALTSEGNMGLVEINSIHCSGIYDENAFDTIIWELCNDK